METAEVIRNAICKGEWVVSIDLTDAYFHIPIHEKSQHLLRFHVVGQTYQFWALPFGIATAPVEFTQVVKEVKLMLQNGNSDSPVSKRLVASCPIRRNLLKTLITHRKEMADLDKSHRTVTKQLEHYTQNSNVFHRDSGFS